MEKPISLSVVVCTYNGAKYLQPQLESLLRQTLMPTEILIHDDGSTDGTLDIAHAYAERFPIIRVVKNEGKHGVNAISLLHCTKRPEISSPSAIRMTFGNLQNWSTSMPPSVMHC